MRRAILVLLCVSIAPFDTAFAAGPQERERCARSYERAQELRRERKLIEARSELLKCLRPKCPTVAKTDCARWLTEVEDSLPSAVFVVRDGDGHEVSDASLSIDGARIDQQVGGAAVTVDPGEHELVIERPNGKRKSQRFVFREGEKNRKVVLTVGSPSPRSKPRPESEPSALPRSAPVPAASYVLAGVALVALGSFAYFAVTSIREEQALRDSCSPNCQDGDVSPVFRRQVAADISLGIAALSLGGATYFYLSSRHSEPDPSAKSTAPSLGRRSYAVSVGGRF